jgi:hypothetical protein
MQAFTANHRPRRSWLQISIRGMLALTALAGIAFAWIASERQKVESRRRAITALHEVNNGNGGVFILDETPENASWRQWLFKKDVGRVEAVQVGGVEASPAHFTPLHHFPETESLVLLFVKVESNVVDLRGMPSWTAPRWCCGF